MEYGFAAEYGGKAFLNEYISLKNKKIIVLDQLSEISKLIQDKSKKIFYICPGGELGEGKESIKQAVLNGHIVIGLVDHYTNPWQRFSDEQTGEILKYKPNKVIVRSEKCAQRLRENGFNEEIEIIEKFFKKKERLNYQSINISGKRLIVIVTEWYAKEKKLKLDQADLGTLDKLLKEIIKLTEKNKNLQYSIKIHPKLIDQKVDFARYTSSKNYVNIKDKIDDELFKLNPIFIGIDSSFLIKANQNNCLTYSWHKEKSSFKISNYESDIIELKNVKDIEWE